MSLRRSSRAASLPQKNMAEPELEDPIEEEDGPEEDEDEDDDDGDDGDDDDNDDNDDNDDDDDDDEDSDNDDGGSGGSSDEQDDDEEDEPPKKRSKITSTKAAAAKKTKTTAAAKKKAAASKKSVKAKAKAKKSAKKSVSKKSSATNGKERKPKVLNKLERLEEARKAYKWWEAPKLPAGVNWRRMECPGVNFVAPYERHNVPLLYDGQPVELTAAQEELATFFASMPLDGPQLGNQKTAKVFIKNFFEDFKAALGSKHVIRDFEKCNFDHIRKHLELQKNLRKAATDEEKAAKKAEKQKLMLKYGYALVDGRLEKV